MQSVRVTNYDFIISTKTIKMGQSLKMIHSKGSERDIRLQVSSTCSYAPTQR